MSTVHTAGINWESIGTLIGTFSLVVGGAAKWIISRSDRSRRNTQEFVRSQVKTFADILDVRLTGIDEKLDEHSSKLSDTRDRVLHIEGQLSATDRGR